MTFENFYTHISKHIFRIANPFKKLIITTDCEVHLFNNRQSIRLLKDYGYINEFEFYRKYLKSFDEGSVWADQNFKSSSHFYNPKTGKGLFGQSHSLDLVKKYYSEALGYYISGKMESAMFYLGACTHVIQDLTIPQHIQVRLLDHHRQYENFVKYTYDLVREYCSDRPPILLPDIADYVEFNARIAMKLYNKYGKIHPLKMRYYKITLSSLPLAQSTTAGVMILFLDDLNIG